MIDFECMLKYDYCDEASEKLIKSVKNLMPIIAECNVTSMKFENLEITEMVLMRNSVDYNTKMVLTFTFGKIVDVCITTTKNGLW